MPRTDAKERAENDRRRQRGRSPNTWCIVWGVGIGDWGLGFGVWGLGFGVWGLVFGVWGLGIWV